MRLELCKVIYGQSERDEIGLRPISNSRLVSISSYSDVLSLSPEISYVHFRKFASKRIISEVLEICKNLDKISISKSASLRLDKSIIENLSKSGIRIVISSSRGRPNLLEGKVW